MTEAASAALRRRGRGGAWRGHREIARMRRILSARPAFARRCSPRRNAPTASPANPEVHYATRFAAKEAMLKALGTGFSRGIANYDVEVRNAKGRPFVVLHGGALEVADERGVRELPLSLSYTHTDAVAARSPSRRVDPRAKRSA
ncbi:MAG: holo-ACP synthase [Eggerthellaceae bacterium]